MGPPRSSTTPPDRAPEAGSDGVGAALRRARAEADRLDRRQRAVAVGSMTLVAAAAARAIVGLVVPAAHLGGSPVVLAAALGIAFALGLAGIVLARRWAERAARMRLEVFWLEVTQTALDREALLAAVLPGRVAATWKDASPANDARPAAARETIDAPSGNGGLWIAAAAMIAVLLGAALRGPAAPARQSWTFTEQAASPADLGLATPVDRAGPWSLEDHEHATGGRALVNRAGAPDERPALAVATSLRARDLRAATRCKVASAASACGLVFRYRDERNHYIARIDGASATVSLAAVVDGAERLVSARAIDASPGAWHQLGVEARGDHLVVTWNGRDAIDARDGALPGEGAIGLWVPAAGVALFDELTVEPLPVRSDLLDLAPLLGNKKS